MTNETNTTMNIENALLFFELVDTGKGISIQSLKKSYYRKCLQFHPDKNPDGLEQFKQIQTYYEYLIEHKYLWCKDDEVYDSDGNSIESENENISQTSSYMDYLKQYVMTFTKKYDWNKDIVEKSIQLILEGAKTTSLKMFEKMDEERTTQIYEYLSKYNTLFQIPDGIMNQLKQIVEGKTSSQMKQIFYLHPSIDEIMNDNIFVYNIDDNDTLYIPLWHNELDYKDNYIVRIHPKLDNNITIDDDNNIHYHMKVDMDELFDREVLYITIGSKILSLYVSTLYIRKYQTVVLKHQGILRINEYEVFDTKKRAHIIIHLYISL